MWLPLLNVARNPPSTSHDLPTFLLIVSFGAWLYFWYRAMRADTTVTWKFQGLFFMAGLAMLIGPGLIGTGWGVFWWMVVVLVVFILVWGRVEDKLKYDAPCAICGKTQVGKAYLSQTCKACDERQQEAFRQEEVRRKKEKAQRDEEELQARLRKLRTREDLQKLSGQEFEEAVMKVFERHGYAVRGTPHSGDGGVDVFVERDGKQQIVQCKNWKAPVGVKEVRELYGVLMQLRKQSKGKKPFLAFLITTGEFTADAKQFANNVNDVLLVDGQEFVNKMFEVSLGDSSFRDAEGNLKL